jgi:hypothetical protein
MLLARFAKLQMNILSALNNREIATMIWLIIALLWALSISGVRRSIRDLLKTFLNIKIVVPFVAMLLYIFLMVTIFKKIGFWDVSAMKDTILWTLGSAFATFFNLNKVSDDEHYFKNVILDNIKFILILEFIINFYSFSLAIELTLIPMITLTIMMSTYSGLKPEYKRVKTLLDYVLGIFGLCLFAFTFRELILDFQNFTTLKNLRDFLIPPLFSIVLLPFVYIMALVMQYEMFFVRIDIANKNSDIVKYTKRKILTACHFNLSKLNRVSKIAGFPKVNGKEDVLEWLKKAKQ